MRQLRRVRLSRLLRLLAVPALVVLSAASLAAQGQPKAATPSLDEILKAVAAYDGGIQSAAVWQLNDYVNARKDDAAGRAECEARLLQFLKAAQTPVARMVAARQLRVIAGDSAVPALQVLLVDDRTSDMAIYVLQTLPGKPAETALVQALAKAKGPTRAAIIAALAERREADAIPALVPLLKQAESARGAALALGSIGTDAAAKALVAAYPTAPAALKPILASATLKCAEKALAAKDAPAALRLYDGLAADTSLPVPLKKAVAMGRISASGPAAQGVLAEMLNGPDEDLQAAAIARIRRVIAPQGIAPVAAVLPRLPAALQVQMLAVLSGYPADAVRPTVLEAARSTSLPVRLAALKALESVGDASSVSVLADMASKTRGSEQAAARSALGMLKGRPVDDAILAMLAQKPSEAVQGELLLAVADRRIFAARPAVAVALDSPSPRVRVQALKALRSLGTPSDIPRVLDLLLKTDDESERTEAETTTAALARKIVRGASRSMAVQARLRQEKEPAARAKLIAVLGRVGDDSALPPVRAALADTNAEVADAAVRAIADWPTGAAREDAMRLASESKDETHKLLAIAGLIRIIGLDDYRAPELAVADLKTAAGFAWRPEERKLVLGELVKFPCSAALELARGFAADPDVKAEAETAVQTITMRMKSPFGRRGR